MTTTPTHIAHIALADDPNRTVCGETWQGWQAPEAWCEMQAAAGLPGPLPPQFQPEQGDTIRQCQGCARSMSQGTGSPLPEDGA